MHMYNKADYHWQGNSTETMVGRAFDMAVPLKWPWLEDLRDSAFPGCVRQPLSE